MPEILTKHPQIVLDILKKSNIHCGEGSKQKILTTCPKENFCSLPTGEICVVGVQNMTNSAQFTMMDALYFPGMGFALCMLFIMIFLLGLLAGLKINK